MLSNVIFVGYSSALKKDSVWSENLVPCNYLLYVTEVLRRLCYPFIYCNGVAMPCSATVFIVHHDNDEC